MVRLRSALEIEVSLPFLASPENASVSRTSVPHNNLIELDCIISRCRSLQIWAGRFSSVSPCLCIVSITPLNRPTFWRIVHFSSCLWALSNKFNSALGNLAQKTPQGKEPRLPGDLLRLLNPSVALFLVHVCLRCYRWQSEKSDEKQCGQKGLCLCIHDDFSIWYGYT